MNFKRFTSIFRYFSWADPIYRWRIIKGDCPLCGKTFFLSFKANPFLTRCLRCKCNITNLSLIPVIKEHSKGDYNKSAYELSSYGCTLDFLRRHFIKVQASEFFPGSDLGQLKDGILNQDVQNLTFPNNSFDIITSNQVFEHVPDDIKGFSECHRVLRTSGAFIFTVPLYDTPETIRKAVLMDNKIIFHGEPEYHDSRLDGAKSSPVFHRHSINDICARVKSTGFSIVELRKVVIAKSQGEPQHVIYAIK